MRVVLLNSEPVDYTIAYANGLAPHAETTAILPRARYAALREWIDPRVRLELVDWPRNRSLRNPAFLFWLSRRLKALDPDVLHLLSNTSPWLNLALPFWRGRPVVTTVHDVTIHPGDRDTARLPGWASRLVARQSDHLIVHGQTLRSAACDTFAKPASAVHVLQHPAICRYAELAQREGMAGKPDPKGFNVLLFGRIFAYKGLETLIRAEARLGPRLPGLRITIAGRGDDPWSLRALMGAPERYDIRSGFIDDPEVARLFSEADVVVLPYDEASQSGVLHVAASFGKPVVVTDVGELRATVEPNGIGLVVPPRAPAELAQALLHLATHPEDHARLARNALDWSRGANAPRTIGAAAVALYAELVDAAAPYAERISVQTDGAHCPERRLDPK